MQPAIDLLRSWGLFPVWNESLFAAENQFAGSDEIRTKDFQHWVDDVNVKAIFCARGGYGSLRIIDGLDMNQFFLKPKWIVGYSDVTVFHSHLHANLYVQTLHATMPINFGKDAESTESLRKALFGETLRYEVLNNTPVPNRDGIAEAPIVGGNLSLLYALAGSRSEMNTAGKILLLEDLDEYLYHVDRMMMNLLRSWKLNNLAGLIIGGMDDMKDNAVPFGKTAEEIIASHVQQYSYPVCFGFPVGHGVKNMAMPFGRKAKLVVEGKRSVLEF